MSVKLSNTQWQALGEKLRSVGFAPESFVRTYEDATSEYGRDYVVFTERESGHKLKISSVSSKYHVEADIPGTLRSENFSFSWTELLGYVQSWAIQLMDEKEALDPWAEEAENMANDDSHFTLEELPRVDDAIEESLAELKTKALEHGVAQKRVESELTEIKSLLQKTARTSTKREWLALFRGIIIEKIVDWGMQTVIFQSVLHTLIVSAGEINQLAEHAVRYLPK